MTPWEPGAELGRYVLDAQLGAGGMGEVWKALDTRLDRTVALKRLLGEHSARFEQEARAIAALNHPHICQIYDVGPDYLVLEYVQGSPLRGPLPADEATRLAIQIASALEEAHRRGILHRDLKPANILVTNEGSAKLLDFGLAKLMDRAGSRVSHGGDTQTRTGTIMGTVAYMSPEQAQGAALDERSDIFSVGAVFYEILSGTRAFDGGSMAETLSAVLRDEPRPLTGSEPLAKVVMRCLRKDPRDRFQTVSEIRAALEQPSAKAPEAARSVAVLPFANIGADPENEYFSDGLAEEILNLLTRVEGLKVIARTSAFAFKGQNTDVRRIAETLGVTHILEGGVRKAGGRIRITAQLIAASDGSHIWSERYDRTVEDVFAVQDEIGQAIATALEAKLALASGAQSRRYEPNVQAYEAYLKGRHHSTTAISPQSVELAKQEYQQALELDPHFPLPHVGLAVLVLMRAMMTLMPAHEAMRLARAEARRALDIDPTLGEAHAMLGIVAAVYDYDWREAERRFGIAMGTAPVTPIVRSMYGFFYLLYLGRTRQAADELSRALKEDPLNIQMRYQRAIALLWSGSATEAISELHQVLELQKTFPFAMLGLALAFTSQGKFQEALVWAQKGFPDTSWDVLPSGILGGLLIKTGDEERARTYFNRLGDGSSFGAPAGLMLYHLICSEVEKAADWAGKAIDERYPGILYFVQSPLAKALRASTRWPELAKRMNLPAEAISASTRSALSL